MPGVPRRQPSFGREGEAPSEPWMDEKIVGAFIENALPNGTNSPGGRMACAVDQTLAR